MTDSKVRVCVLNANYEADAANALRDFDVLPSGGIGPHLYYPADNPKFVFEVHVIRKATAWKQVKSLISSHKFDVFFNLCDGTDEDERAGFDVVRCLEFHKVPFTGAGTVGYDVSKLDQKMIAYYNQVETAKYAHVKSEGHDPNTPEGADAIKHIVQERCALLRFPVIVKQPQGYGSVGSTRDCKCADMHTLCDRVVRFIAEQEEALVEEFISGGEATVLICADPDEPRGVRVYPPLMMTFPAGEDWKHFDLRWGEHTTGCAVPSYLLQEDHPAYAKLVDFSRTVFNVIQRGVGYARADFRIDGATNTPYFLELNANMGIMGGPELKDECSADKILRIDPNSSIHQFIELQISAAMARAQMEPFLRQYDSAKGYHLVSTRDIKENSTIFHEEGAGVRLVSVSLLDGHSIVPITLATTPVEVANLPAALAVGGASLDVTLEDGKKHSIGGVSVTATLQVSVANAFRYAMWHADPCKWRPFNHSCDPNVRIGQAASFGTRAIALRPIKRGEELTVDYAELADALMPPFECQCGSTKCRKLVAPVAHSHCTANLVVTSAAT